MERRRYETAQPDAANAASDLSRRHRRGSRSVVATGANDLEFSSHRVPLVASREERGVDQRSEASRAVLGLSDFASARLTLKSVVASHFERSPSLSSNP